MARFNEEYYSGEDYYSDGDVENTILKLVKEGKRIEDLSQEALSYPIIYHLSKVRQNIFLWYPFKTDARILEIGAGCGAITGVLCEKAKEVVAVELSHRRASINYERNKAYDNLEILVGNFNDIPVKAEFDYIILNGVFEYAASFTEGEHPYETFLAGIAKRLKPEGSILIAIENRLGAKYFAGAPEDHTDRYFLGMNQYAGVDTVKTFTKSELEGLCESIGLVCERFYYPYPDYKFPYEIFTDETVNTSMYGRPMFQFSDRRLELFSETRLNQTLAKEQIADKFANSFLVEVKKRDAVSQSSVESRQDTETMRDTETKRDIKYVKLNTDRKAEFQIYTTIWEEAGKQYVSKYPVSAEAKTHVTRMNAPEIAAGKNWNYLLGEEGETGIKYPYLEAKTLDDEVTRLLLQEDTQGIKTLIAEFYQTFLSEHQLLEDYQTPEFREVFGEAVCNGKKRCCKNLDIDLIFDNIFCIDGKYAVIDTEWIFPFYIPVEYVMWRVLNELYYKHATLERLIKCKELQETYGITPEDAITFKAWEVHFAYEYVGSYALQNFEKQPLRPDFEQIATYYERERYIDSKLYINTGHGYREEEAVSTRVALHEGHFTLNIPVQTSEKIISLRWDPADVPCQCKVESVNGNVGELRCVPQNHLNQNEAGELFFTNDPIYEVRGKINGLSQLEIEGTIHYLTQNELIEEWGVLVKKWKKEPKGNLLTKIVNKLRTKGEN